MKIDSVLKPKHMAWASGALLAVILLIVLTRSGTKASVQAPPPPIVEVATASVSRGTFPFMENGLGLSPGR